MAEDFVLGSNKTCPSSQRHEQSCLYQKPVRHQLRTSTCIHLPCTHSSSRTFTGALCGRNSEGPRKSVDPRSLTQCQPHGHTGKPVQPSPGRHQTHVSSGAPAPVDASPALQAMPGYYLGQAPGHSPVVLRGCSQPIGCRLGAGAAPGSLNFGAQFSACSWSPLGQIRCGESTPTPTCWEHRKLSEHSHIRANSKGACSVLYTSWEPQYRARLRADSLMLTTA